jgi:hypothetical protein
MFRGNDMNRTHRFAAVVLGAGALTACTVNHTTAAAPPAPEPVPHTSPTLVHRPALRPTPAAQPVTGWSKLGGVRADGRGDRDTIWVRGWDDRYRALRLRVDRSDLRLHDVVIEFENGATYSPTGPSLLMEGDTYTIDLPGRSQRVRAIHFRHSNIRGFGRAQVEVWGR